LDGTDFSVVAAGKWHNQAGDQNRSKAKTVQHLNLLEFPHAGLTGSIRLAVAIP
jgi:hypothetical protein